MVRGALSAAVAAAAFAGTAFAGAKCSKDSHCPSETPCCSCMHPLCHLNIALLTMLFQCMATVVWALFVSADATRCFRTRSIRACQTPSASLAPTNWIL